MSEVKMTKEKDNKTVIILKSCIFAIVMGLIALLVFVLTYKKELTTTSEVESGEVTYLECTTNHVENSFFTSEDAQRYSHSLKIKFIEDKIADLFYRYEATFQSEDAANSAEAKLHADYNKYFDSYQIDPGTINSTFGSEKQKLRISLLASPDKLGVMSSKLFFIDEDTLKDFSNISRDDFNDYYEKNDFSCKDIK